MSEQAISIRDLSVRAGKKTILSIADLCIDHGECVGVLGPNGAGKSTLMKGLIGMRRHTRGQLDILGYTLSRLGFHKLALLRRQVGYVPQLLPARSETPLTVREVVAIGRTGTAGLFQRLSAADWRIVDEWIDRLGLKPLASRGYGEISGGEQRKTLIAKAMVQQPRMLLLDEPTANLDPGWRERIVELIESLHQAYALTIVMVCHELEVLPSCCRRVVMLQAGRVIADGPPEQVLSDDRIKSVYGPGLTVLHGGGRHAVVPARMSP